MVRDLRAGDVGQGMGCLVAVPLGMALLCVHPAMCQSAGLARDCDVESGGKSSVVYSGDGALVGWSVGVGIRHTAWLRAIFSGLPGAGGVKLGGPVREMPELVAYRA